ncbi:MAG TPA: type IV pili methyl-accepting chemotaxis transducer N-terminal domain-containing protein, partial [Burkholderiales bacterium]|nr:type IV pili methyl-accepting chemotaxis transducer N-terminal domain-containing protein [Burkholderiales bacterium]
MSSNESARFFGKYTEIVYAVLLFLVIDLAVLALGFYTSFQIAADASSINLAGRQRMLSQRMTKALFNLKAEASQGGSVASDVAELTATVELFDGVLSAFRTGGEVRDSDNRLVWFNAIDTETGRVILNDAYAIWSPYRDSIRRLLANGQNPAEIDIAVNRARTTNLVLLDLMNRLTADIEEVASARAAQLRHVQLIGIGLALLNFVFILFKFIRRLREGDRLVDEAQRVTNEVKASADAAERLHQEDLRRFRAAVDLCVDAILLVDYAVMRYVDVNETACRMLGFTRAELLERGPQELAAPYRRGLKRDYDDLIESGEVRMAIGECRRKDGSLIPVEVSRRAQRSGDAWLV